MFELPPPRKESSMFPQTSPHSSLAKTTQCQHIHQPFPGSVQQVEGQLPTCPNLQGGNGGKVLTVGPDLVVGSDPLKGNPYSSSSPVTFREHVFFQSSQPHIRCWKILTRTETKHLTTSRSRKTEQFSHTTHKKFCITHHHPKRFIKWWY